MHATALAIAVLWGALTAPSLFALEESPNPEAAPKYLLFQIFTGALDPSIPIGGQPILSDPPPKAAVAGMVQQILEAIGTTGSSDRKLGFAIGPVALDHTDEELRRMIKEAFEIAVERNVAVAFHLDDSMFWGKRAELWSKIENIEWLDWDKTPNTGRLIEWSPTPTRFAPQMCLNSPGVEREIRRVAGVIGQAIAEETHTLASLGKTELFAGVIAGWETQISRDFDTGKRMGYCALTNNGFSAATPPAVLDREREKIVQAFMELWAKALADAGVDRRKIYAHVAFVSKKLYGYGTGSSPTYSEVAGFSPPEVAFSSFYQPGFSTYPQSGLLEDLYEVLAKHGNPAWASSEGTAIEIGEAFSGGSGISMETYLAGLFNHGAALVNIFAWGVGGEGHTQDPFRVATENQGAIAAYRKFLRGEALQETPYVLITDRLPRKVRTIQQELPRWIQQTGRQADAEPLMQRLDLAMKRQQLHEAEQIADQILSLIGQSAPPIPEQSKAPESDSDKVTR